MSSVRSQRQFGLDLVRAIAITFVVLSHYVNGIVPLGHLGVDIFFVLSGYLIGSILYRSFVVESRLSSTEFYEFLRRRWYRTVPNYLLFLFLYFMLQYQLRLESVAPLSDIPVYLAFLQNFAWPQPLFFVVSWSLCVEEWFYLLCAISLLILVRPIRRANGSAKTAMTLTATFLILAPLALRTFFPVSVNLADEKTIVIYRLDAIAFGLLLAILKNSDPRFWHRHRWVLATAGTLVFVIVQVAGELLVPTFLRYSLIPISLALTIPFAEHLPVPNHVIATVVTKISQWSYSIYLSHMLIYLGLKTFVNYDSFSLYGKLAYKLVTLAMIVSLSAANYRLFEKPMMDLRERKSMLALIKDFSIGSRPVAFPRKSE